MNIPYLYIVGDGVPKNLISVAGDGDDSTVGQQSWGGYIILQVIDQYGAPAPVTTARDIQRDFGRRASDAGIRDHLRPGE